MFLSRCSFSIDIKACVFYTFHSIFWCSTRWVTKTIHSLLFTLSNFITHCGPTVPASLPTLDLTTSVPMKTRKKTREKEGGRGTKIKGRIFKLAPTAQQGAGVDVGSEMIRFAETPDKTNSIISSIKTETSAFPAAPKMPPPPARFKSIANKT